MLFIADFAYIFFLLVWFMFYRICFNLRWLCIPLYKNLYMYSCMSSCKYWHFVLWFYFKSLSICSLQILIFFIFCFNLLVLMYREIKILISVNYPKKDLIILWFTDCINKICISRIKVPYPMSEIAKSIVYRHIITVEQDMVLHSSF